MSFNFKPINEVPEIDAVSVGDKLLVNSNGAAKQIDASKIGGGGGGTVYLNVLQTSEDFSEMVVQCYADEGLTMALDYETGKKLFMSGASAYVSIPTGQTTPAIVSINFSLLAWEYLAEKSAMGLCITHAGTVGMVNVLFSDTVID